MVKKLDRDELIEIVKVILRPKGFTSQEIDQKLLLFAANCPDPAGAMDLIIETLGPITAEEIVDRSLALPARDPRSLSESELHPNHPLRGMSLDS